MSKNMLIDSAHLEEIRVAVVDGEKLDKFDFETPSRTQIKGNIYLGKIVRVEPSLQAAFVDFGSEKHGFLSFSEIHYDYFQIPVGDRKELESRIQSAMTAFAEESDYEEGEMDSREIAKLRYQFYRRYKIQEVIKKRQIMLVQVTKEERGSKGAALTTYLSLAGRYCVLMPNMSKGNGVSRKISNQEDRAKLKKIVSEFHVENGSTVIRTAGVSHSKIEIKKDFDYLTKSWDEIREITLKSTAPTLVYEEANIIKRAIRDLYTRDIEFIIVEGDEGYRIAKDFVKKLMPSHSKKVKLYYDKKIPLFSKYKINDQVNQIYSTRVDLPSGGYIIVNTTEALISIDVNSGKSTRERNIGGTALKTNLEAAVEIARQCRLRDLAGLIVVDFIDMEEKRDNAQVEKCLRDALREDKAKIQIGAISNFGLLEFSRQRLRSSITDVNMVVCPHCEGVGAVWSDESIALQILRKIEETCLAVDLKEVEVTLSMNIALYLLNNKKSFIASIENRGLKIIFKIDPAISTSDFKISQVMKPVQENEEFGTARYNFSKKDQKNDNKRKQVNFDSEKGKVFEAKDSQAMTNEIVLEESNDIKPTTYMTRSHRNRKRGYHRNRYEKNQTKENNDVDFSVTEVSGDLAEPKQVFDVTIKKTPQESKNIDDIKNNNDNVLIKKNYHKRRRIRTSKDTIEKASELNETRIESMRNENSLGFPEEKNELMELAKTYRELEQEMEQARSQKTENSLIKQNRKKGWWQRLIKKPSDQ